MTKRNAQERPAYQQVGRHAAIAKISTEELAKLLRLPEGSVIRMVYQEPTDQMTAVVSMLIEHPSLPIVKEAEMPSTIVLIYAQGQSTLIFGDLT